MNAVTIIGNSFQQTDGGNMKPSESLQKAYEFCKEHNITPTPLELLELAKFLSAE
jgi:hypothetical protein